MPKELRAAEIPKLISQGVKRKVHSGYDKLYLETTEAKTGYWMARPTVDGKQIEFRFAKAPDWSLKQAGAMTPVICEFYSQVGREKMKAFCSLTQDPVELRGYCQVGSVPSKPQAVPCFETFARQWFQDTIQPSSISEKGKRQKINQLELYVFPKIGKKPMNEVYHKDILDLLRPMWLRKGDRGGYNLGRGSAGYDSATKVLGNIREIFAQAAKNPQITQVLTNPTPSPKDFPKKQNQKNHQTALPYEVIPDFWKWLWNDCNSDDVTKTAVATALLLGKRDKEVRMLIWDYIDFEDSTFNAPAYFTNLMGERENFTKNGQSHIQVMPTQLVELFKTIKPVTQNNAFALSLHPEKPLSANTLAKVIKQYGWTDERGQGATVHGLRNTLGTWMEDNVGWNEMLRKHTLQHTIESLEKPYLVRKQIARENERRKAMQAWANYVTGVN